MWSIVVAAGLLALGLLVRLPLDTMISTPLPPYITVYPLLPVIGFAAGFRVGAAVVIVALVLAWFFWIEPFGSFDILDLRTAFVLAIFLIAGPVTVAFGAVARHALEQVAAQNADAQRNAREAVHRTKNVLASVIAILRGEARRAESVSDLTTRVEETIRAVSRAQDVLIASPDLPSSLARLVDAGVSTCAHNPRLRIMGGPDIDMPEGDWSGLVLALHELCTNSFKYGALGSEEGSVAISWSDGAVCTLHWVETGVKVTQTSDSFGSTLIRSALSKSAGASVDYVRTADEIRCAFNWPPARLG